MAIEIWLPALLGYLIPIGLFLLAWGGMDTERARRSTTVGALALSLAALGYFATGFAFHLGGAQVVDNQPAYKGLGALYETADNWGLIGLAGFFLTGSVNDAPVPLTPEALALFVNYLPMVTTAVLLVTLSVHGRARAWQVVIGGLVVSAVLFPIVACWAWGGGWLTTIGHVIAPPAEGGPQHGFIDYAGSGVVYLLGGLAALGALIGLGQRVPRGEPDEPVPMPPSHYPLLANLGAMLVGLGLMSWSLSIPFHVAGARLNLPHIAVNVLLSAAGAILTTQTYCWLATSRADPLMSARGAVAGFVAIAAGAPFVPHWSALMIGALVGTLLPLGVYLVEHVMRLPDSTATVALGITAGLIGLLAVAIVADGLWGQGWNGVGMQEYQTEMNKGVTGFIPARQFETGDGQGQLIAQLAGIGAIGLPAFLVGLGTFWVINLPYTRPWERWTKAKSTAGSATE